ncbi:hypothetical protein D3C72_2309060 [compost metagenome]
MIIFNLFYKPKMEVTLWQVGHNLTFLVIKQKIKVDYKTFGLLRLMYVVKISPHQAIRLFVWETQ